MIIPRTIPARIGRWFRDAVTSNLGLKLLSLFFAFGLVAYQRSQHKEQVRTIPVGIVLRLPPDHTTRELMTSVPPTIHVTVRGSARAIDELNQARIPPVELDLRDAERDQVTFEPSMFSFPPDVEIKIIDPASIDLEWQNIITREIPIQASMTGKVAEGYVVGEVAVSPKTIEVRGPASVVEVMQFGRLAAFDISGKTDGAYKHLLALDPPPPRVKYLGPASATVSVTIRRRVVHRVFEDIKVEVIGPVKAATNPRKVNVTVIGPPEVVNGLREDLVIPRVTLSLERVKEQPRGSAMIPVSVDLAKVDTEVQPPNIKVSW